MAQSTGASTERCGELLVRKQGRTLAGLIMTQLSWGFLFRVRFSLRSFGGCHAASAAATSRRTAPARKGHQAQRTEAGYRDRTRCFCVGSQLLVMRREQASATRADLQRRPAWLVDVIA
jgi:hypothetical protein